MAIVPISQTEPPQDLKDDGRALWTEVIAHARWLGRTDLFSLLTLCRLEDQKAAMTAVVVRDGYTLKEPLFTPKADVMGDRVVAHPLLKEIRGIQKQQDVIAAALGLSPTARSRLGVAEVKAASKLEELQAKQRDRRVAAKVADAPASRTRKPRANRGRVHRKLLPRNQGIDRRPSGGTDPAAGVAESPS